MQRATHEVTQQFLMRRLAQEEAAARTATDPRARESHSEMARLYREACNDFVETRELQSLTR